MPEPRMIPLSRERIGVVLWTNYCTADTPELKKWYEDGDDLIWSLQKEDFQNADIRINNENSTGNHSGSVVAPVRAEKGIQPAFQV